MSAFCLPVHWIFTTAIIIVIPLMGYLPMCSPSCCRITPRYMYVGTYVFYACWYLSAWTQSSYVVSNDTDYLSNRYTFLDAYFLLYCIVRRTIHKHGTQSTATVHFGVADSKKYLIYITVCGSG